MPRRRPLIALVELGLIVSFVCSYLLFHFRYFSSFSEWVLGGSMGDPAIYLWLTHKALQNASLDIHQFFSAGFFYPFGQALAYTDNFILPSLVASTLRSLGMGEALAYNSVIIGASALNGYSTYRLSYRITKERSGAFTAGLLFMLSPFFFSQLPHPQLQFSFFLVFALESALAYVETQRRTPALAIGLSVLGAFLCSVYIALFSIILLMAFFIFITLLRPRTLSLKSLPPLLIVNVPAVLLLYWFATPYMEVKEVFGGKRPEELARFSLNVMSYFSTPNYFPIWGFSHTFPNYEARLGFGLSAFLLSILGLRSWFKGESATRRERNFRLFCLTSLVVAICCQSYTLIYGKEMASVTRTLLLAVPMWLTLVSVILLVIFRSRPQSIKAKPLTAGDYAVLLLALLIFFHFAAMGLTSPAHGRDFRPGLFYLLFSYVPGFDALRVPGRLGIVLLLLLSLFAAKGVASILAKKTLLRISITGILIVVALLERMPIGGPVGPIVKNSAINNVLQKLPEDAPLLGLPQRWVGDTEKFVSDSTLFMMQTRELPNPIVNGYSGVMPGYVTHMGRTTHDFPSAKSIQHIARVVGLEHIVYRSSLVENFKKDVFEQALQDSSTHLSLLEKDSEGNYLLKFHPEVFVRHMTFYLPPKPLAERVLEFELCYKGEVEQPERLHLQVKTGQIPRTDIPTRLKPAKEDIILKRGRNDCWEKKSLNIPRSTGWVKAHKVEFATHLLPQGGNLMLRNLQLKR